MFKRRSILAAGLVLAALGLAPAVQAAPANILTIWVDDLRLETAPGSGPLKTPNIDRLGNQGVRFDNAFVQFSLCNPSRTSFLLGRYPASTGVLGNSNGFRAKHPDYVTLPQYFKGKGYTTLSVGKTFHLSDPPSWNEDHRIAGDDLPSDPHNNAWFAATGPAADALQDDRITDKAIQLLSTPRAKPFFLSVGYARPHTRYVCPKEKVDLYPVANMVLPSNFASRPKAPPGVPGAVRPNNADLFQREVVTPQRAKTALSHYFGCVSHIDDQIGRLLGRLDQLQLRSNTIVVFMSDHGYMLGERGKWANMARCSTWVWACGS